MRFYFAQNSGVAGLSIVVFALEGTVQGLVTPTPICTIDLESDRIVFSSDTTYVSLVFRSLTNTISSHPNGYSETELADKLSTVLAEAGLAQDTIEYLLDELDEAIDEYYDRLVARPLEVKQYEAPNVDQPASEPNPRWN